MLIALRSIFDWRNVSGFSTVLPRRPLCYFTSEEGKISNSDFRAVVRGISTYGGFRWQRENVSRAAFAISLSATLRSAATPGSEAPPGARQSSQQEGV